MLEMDKELHPLSLNMECPQADIWVWIIKLVATEVILKSSKEITGLSISNSTQS